MIFQIFPEILDTNECVLVSSNKDIIIYRSIKLGGINYINTSYKNSIENECSSENKYYLKSYSLNYIISNIYQSFNKNDNVLFEKMLLNNDTIIQFFMENDTKYIDLQKQFFSCLISVIINKYSYANKIKCFKNLIKYKLFEKYFFENNWIFPNGNDLENNSFLGILISLIETQDAEPLNIETQDVEPQNIEPQNLEALNVEPLNVEPQNVEPQNIDTQDVKTQYVKTQNIEPKNMETKNKDIFNFMKYLICNYKNQLTNWYESLIKINLKNKQTVSIITKNKNLSSLDFLVKTLNLTIELYKDACFKHKKTIDNIDKNIFNIKHISFNWECEHTDKKFKDFNFFSKIFAYITKLIDISISPLIFSIGYDETELTKINNLINIEETSLRWNNIGPNSKKLYIDSLIIKKERHEKKIFKKNTIINKSNVISNLIYIINDISKFIRNVNYKNLPNCIIDNISIFLNYNKTSILSEYPGLDFKNILILVIDILSNNSLKSITNTKINLLKFIFINNHIITNILISIKDETLNLNNYLSSLKIFYIDIDKNSSETIFYDKMPIRYQINNIFEKMLKFYNEKKTLTKNIFDISLQKMVNGLEKFFSIKENIEQIIYILIADNSYYFEEIVSSFDKIDILMNKLKISTIMRDKLKFEDTIYREMTIISSYWLYFKTGLTFLKLLNINFPEICFSELLGDKLVNGLNFYLYRTLNYKYAKKIYNSNIYNFEIKLDEIYDIIRDIYIENCSNEQFIEYMSNDNRSYESEYLIKIVSGMNSDSYVKIETLINNVKQKNKLKLELQNIEYPPEFCDPIMMTPINEPCILPESEIFIEKNTIISHLMLDKTDPFNRTPLTIENLNTFNNTDKIKEKIKDFLERKEKWKNNYINDNLK